MRLGRFLLVRRLAIGGMAEIYLAHTRGIEGFEKFVVLKRILPQFAANEEFIKMFTDEARIAATLHHPNVAQVYEIGQAGGSYFFTMEYVHGEDVRNIIKQSIRSGRPIPLEHAIFIVLGTAAGLHYAHEKKTPRGEPLGIVHRDVSPSNVLVTFDGCVKLVDFGIAKAASRQVETRTGTLKGKLAYMSPEQCRGEPLDRRSDVFAIGILLYELTTGTKLFNGDTEFAIMNQIVNQDVPPPSLLRADFPSGLEPILLKALKRNRDERYASGQELQVDLENFAREQKMVISPVAVTRYMEELFGKRAEAWRDCVIPDDPPSGAVVETMILESDEPAPPQPSHSGRRSAVHSVPTVDDEALDGEAQYDDAEQAELLDDGSFLEEPQPPSRLAQHGRLALALVTVAGLAIGGTLFFSGPRAPATAPPQTAARPRAAATPGDPSAAQGDPSAPATGTTGLAVPPQGPSEGPAPDTQGDTNGVELPVPQPSTVAIQNRHAPAATEPAPTAPPEGDATSSAAAQRGVPKPVIRPKRPVGGPTAATPASAPATVKTAADPSPARSTATSGQPRSTSSGITRPKLWDPDSPLPP
jgi:serine/threonine protein kinase